MSLCDGMWYLHAVFMMRCLKMTCGSMWYLTIQDVVMTMILYSHDDMRELACGFFL
jgi:hypothetical protein